MSDRSAVSIPDQAEKSSVKLPNEDSTERVRGNGRGPGQRFQQIQRTEQARALPLVHVVLQHRSKGPLIVIPR